MHLDDALRQISSEAEREAKRFRQFAAWSQPHAALGDDYASQAENHARSAILWTQRAEAAAEGMVLSNDADPDGWRRMLGPTAEAARAAGRLIELAVAE